MSLGLFFAVCLLISIASIRIGMRLVARFGFLDHPGGHKQHDVSTPFVGGVGVFVVLASFIVLARWVFPETPVQPLHWLVVGAAILFVTGLADDIWTVSFRNRFVIQALVASLMIFLGDVQLVTLGEIIPGLDRVDLGWLSVPFTIFAAVGLINALNMIDGIDGLSGSLSLVSLGFVAALAALAGDSVYLLVTIALTGGVAGFLYYNLRYPGNRRARVFLGNNGSILLGFVFSWLFIALSQGEQAAMTPVTALWLFAVPLMDTVSVMVRRTWVGKSPFHADRNHLHHLFVRAGFRVSDTVLFILLAQLILAFLGITGLLMDAPESVMFGLFLLVFAVYFFAVAQPRRAVPILRLFNSYLGFPVANSCGVFVGYFGKENSQEVLDILSEQFDSQQGYRLSLHRSHDKPAGSASVFALIEIEGVLDEAAFAEIRRLSTLIKARMAAVAGVQVRPLINRSSDNDRRGKTRQAKVSDDSAQGTGGDRRSEPVLLYSSVVLEKKTEVDFRRV